jgi:hypothetical protein
MRPGVAQVIDEGRTAFNAGQPFSTNPYGTRRPSPLDARVRDAAWSHGWLRESGMAELQRLEGRRQLMRQAQEVAAAAFKNRRSTF